MNKAEKARVALGLSYSEAGRLFTGNTNRPYDIWKRWEETGNWPSPVDVLFKTILTLKMAEDLRTPGASRALKLVLDMLTLNDEYEGT